mgnify:CR=1 FL=1
MGEAGKEVLQVKQVPILSFFTRKLNEMKMKASNLKRIRLEEFDATLTEKWCAEGRLYVCVTPSAEKETAKQEMTEYVKRINCFATHEWAASVDALWNRIADEPVLMHGLTMKNGVQAGHMNRYVATLLVCLLQNKGVYRRETSMLELHLAMEGTTVRNKYYLSCGNYGLSDEARVALNRIVRELKTTEKGE